MDIEYTINVHGVRVAAEGDLVDVVKEVEYTLTGCVGSVSFALPNRMKLSSVDPEHFTPFGELTEAQLVEWVEADPNTQSSKDHIAHVVAKEVERTALEQKPLPWAPPPPDPSPAIVTAPPEAA